MEAENARGVAEGMADYIEEIECRFQYLEIRNNLDMGLGHQQAFTDWGDARKVQDSHTATQSHGHTPTEPRCHIAT